MNSLKIDSNYIVCRAFRKLPHILNISRENCVKKHKIIVMKGKNAQEEINNTSQMKNYEYRLENSITDNDSKIIIMGFVVIPLVIIYPLVKRFSYFPQFVLGLIFNWGIFIGYFSSNQILDWRIFFLYFAGVFLTISYDTIYGFQDIDDDKKIGVKSFSILIEKQPVLFISILYLISFILFSSFFFSFYENLLFNVICCFFILNFFFFQVLDFIKKKRAD